MMRRRSFLIYGASTALLPTLCAATASDADAPDDEAIGAILALQQAHVDLKTVVVAGVDATPDGLAEMSKGHLGITVFQDAKSQGRVAVDTALKMAKGETVPSHVDVPFELVTPDNMKNYTGR